METAALFKNVTISRVGYVFAGSLESKASRIIDRKSNYGNSNTIKISQYLFRVGYGFGDPIV